MKYEYQASRVKDDARGRWQRVLSDLAPALQEAVAKRGKHVPCPVHGGRDGFRVFPDVSETGGGVCNTCGYFADGFSLLMWINSWDFGQTIREVAQQLAGAPTCRVPRSTSPGVSPCGSQDDTTRREQLNRTWRESLPLTHREAEPARLYLARRGLTTRVREALRFHPDLGYYADQRLVGCYPAILAQVTGQGGDAVTLHRTYLTVDGHKAPVDAPKKLMRHERARTAVRRRDSLGRAGQSSGGDRRHRDGVGRDRGHRPSHLGDRQRPSSGNLRSAARRASGPRLCRQGSTVSTASFRSRTGSGEGTGDSPLGHGDSCRCDCTRA
jgi:hypothetical protein